MLRTVAAGSGSVRPLIVVYHLASGSKDRPFIDDRLRAAAGDSGAAIVNYTAPVIPARGTTGGAYASVGAKASDGQTLQPLSEILRSLGARLSCTFEKVVLVGFSEGCQAPRAQLSDGAVPDAILAVDGIHGHYPTPDAARELTPWSRYFDRARAGSSVMTATHTMIPTEPTFTMGQHMLQKLTGTELAPGPDPAHPNVYRDGALTIWSYPGTDAKAHEHQAQVVLPLRLRDVLVALGLVAADAPFPIDVSEGGAAAPPLVWPAAPTWTLGPILGLAGISLALTYAAFRATNRAPLRL